MPAALHPFRFPGILAVQFKTFLQIGTDPAMSFSTFWEAAAAYADYAGALAAANDYAAGMNPLLQPLFTDQVSILQHQVIYRSDAADFDSADSTGIFVGNAAVIVLEAAGSRELPSQDAYEIQRRTAHTYRDAYGRIFIPGVWENFNNNGRLTTAGQDALSAVAAYLGADRTFNGIVHHARHWSRKTDTLLPVVKCRGMIDLYSRRDRMPKAPRLPIPG